MNGVQHTSVWRGEGGTGGEMRGGPRVLLLRRLRATTTVRTYTRIYELTQTHADAVNKACGLAIDPTPGHGHPRTPPRAI